MQTIRNQNRFQAILLQSILQRPQETLTKAILNISYTVEESIFYKMPFLTLLGFQFANIPMPTLEILNLFIIVITRKGNQRDNNKNIYNSHNLKFSHCNNITF